MNILTDGLIVAEFIPHDSKPQFGSLNHALGATINSEPAFPESPPNRTCCGHAKIDENDPNRTWRLMRAEHNNCNGQAG
jgi:hypothetical protein